MFFDQKLKSSIDILATSQQGHFIAIADQNAINISQFSLAKSNDGKYSYSSTNRYNIEIPIKSRVTGIAFDENKVCKFGYTTSKSICVYEEDKKILERNPHNGPINSLAFLSDSHVITASDDHTCQIIALDDSGVEMTIRKMSNVARVSTHYQNPNEFILSEESGVNSVHDIRVGVKEVGKFYTETKNVKPKQPLYDSHWNPNDIHAFAAVADYEFFIWDLRHSEKAYKSVAHHTGAFRIRWGQANVVATTNATDTLTVHNILDFESDPYSQNFQQHFPIRGLGWSNTNPDFCITGCDKSIRFWKPNW